MTERSYGVLTIRSRRRTSICSASFRRSNEVVPRTLTSTGSPSGAKPDETLNRVPTSAPSASMTGAVASRTRISVSLAPIRPLERSERLAGNLHVKRPWNRCLAARPPEIRFGQWCANSKAVVAHLADDIPMFAEEFDFCSSQKPNSGAVG